MFKGFDIQKYLDKKPPSDGSFTTTQEIKELNSIPINERFVKEKDDIKSSFLKLAKKKDLNISSEDLDKVIAESAKVILKIKKHHNRPRPKVLAKKNNIKFDDKELDSMKTPSYPSGHSVQGILIARLIGEKFPKHAKEFLKLGKEISYSRNVAHAHYKSDSKFGEQLGKDMFEHLKPSSPLKCWKGYERVAGTAKGSKGSCKKSSPVKKTTDNDMVKASNGTMVPKSELKRYEQSIKQAKIELAKKRIASTYKQTAFNPVFREVATAAILAPIKAFNIGKKVVSYGRNLDRLSKAKKTVRKVDAVNDVRQLKSKR